MDGIEFTRTVQKIWSKRQGWAGRKGLRAHPYCEKYHAPDPCKSSFFVTSSHSPQMSIDRLLKALESVYSCPFALTR